jgi:HEAT repeat protein
LIGDEDPAVLTECLGALLRLAPEPSLPFVVRFLNRDGEATQEAAALALGGSRLEPAFTALRQWWERTPEPGLRRTALLAIAMSKRDAAIDFLLNLIAEGDGPSARDAVAALAMYRHDDALAGRVREAARRADVDLRQALRDAFGD